MEEFRITTRSESVLTETSFTDEIESRHSGECVFCIVDGEPQKFTDVFGGSVDGQKTLVLQDGSVSENIAVSDTAYELHFRESFIQFETTDVHVFPEDNAVTFFIDWFRFYETSAYDTLLEES